MILCWLSLRNFKRFQVLTVWTAVSVSFFFPFGWKIMISQFQILATGTSMVTWGDLKNLGWFPPQVLCLGITWSRLVSAVSPTHTTSRTSQVARVKPKKKLWYCPILKSYTQEEKSGYRGCLTVTNNPDLTSSLHVGPGHRFKLRFNFKGAVIRAYTRSESVDPSIRQFPKALHLVAGRGHATNLLEIVEIIIGTVVLDTWLLGFGKSGNPAGKEGWEIPRMGKEKQRGYVGMDMFIYLLHFYIYTRWNAYVYLCPYAKKEYSALNNHN